MEFLGAQITWTARLAHFDCRIRAARINQIRESLGCSILLDDLQGKRVHLSTFALFSEVPPVIHFRESRVMEIAGGDPIIEPMNRRRQSMPHQNGAMTRSPFHDEEFHRMRIPAEEGKATNLSLTRAHGTRCLKPEQATRCKNAGDFFEATIKVNYVFKN